MLVSSVLPVMPALTHTMMPLNPHVHVQVAVHHRAVCEQYAKPFPIKGISLPSGLMRLRLKRLTTLLVHASVHGDSCRTCLSACACRILCAYEA